MAEPLPETESKAIDELEGTLICAWPQPRLAVNTPDKLELGVGEVAAGLKSHLMLIMDWYNVGRDEALEIVAQIKRDEADLAAIHPGMAEARTMVPAAPPSANGEADSADDDTQDATTGQEDTAGA